MESQRYSEGFRSLIVWREAHALAIIIYKLTRSFPSDERFGIISQLRRASSSVGAQIAEGSRMSSSAHRKIYYERAYASNAEVDNFLELSFDLGYLDSSLYQSTLSAINRVGFLLKKIIGTLLK